ncbi:MAG: HD domain-containing protein [Polyangiaceae bacterium]
MSDGPAYSPRVDAALVLAAEAFRHVRRSRSDVPYLMHLLQVMVTVGENGGDEDQLIAAVLHDYLEDVPGTSEAELREKFGDRVARLVVALTDSVERPKPPWKERKMRYLAHLANEPAEVKLISVADKIHNARSIRRDRAHIGQRVWEKFSASQEEVIWYYRELVRSLGRGWSHPLVDELAVEVEDLG